jgi:hypothetical protein
VFDIRYHALSLAAVLVALVVGLLLGVAIGDANLVSSAQKGLGDSLRRDVAQAERQNTKLDKQLTLRRRFEDQIYPNLVSGQLAGKRVGLLFLGASTDRVNGLVRASLVQTGAQLTLVAGLREPPDVGSLASESGPTRYRNLVRDPSLLRPLGQRMGRPFARGAGARGARLFGRLRNTLFSSFNGPSEQLDGVVVIRDRGPFGAGEQSSADALEAGLIEGLTASNVPVVGVELTSTNPSQIAWYRQRSLASVDDLDDVAGRTALVFALAGAHGAYGQKPSAESLLPKGPGAGQ